MSNYICENSEILTIYGFKPIEELVDKTVCFIDKDGAKFKGIATKNIDKRKKYILRISFKSEIFSKPMVKEIVCCDGQIINSLDKDYEVTKSDKIIIVPAKLNEINAIYNDSLVSFCASILYYFEESAEKYATYKYEEIENQLGKYIIPKNDDEAKILKEVKAIKLYSNQDDVWFLPKKYIIKELLNEWNYINVYNRKFINRFINLDYSEKDESCFSIKNNDNNIKQIIKDVLALNGHWYIGDYGKYPLPFFLSKSFNGFDGIVESKEDNVETYSINPINTAETYVDSNGIIYNI